MGGAALPHIMCRTRLPGFCDDATPARQHDGGIHGEDGTVSAPERPSPPGVLDQPPGVLDQRVAVRSVVRKGITVEPQLPEPAGPNSTRSDSEIAVMRFCEHLKRILGTSSSAPTPATSPPLSGTRESAGPADLAELREAGRRAIEMYPGPVGDLIARELEAAAAFGFRIASGAPFQRLVNDLLDRRPPTAPVAEPDQRAGTP